jgi:Do/DeqQ family serine protease
VRLKVGRPENEARIKKMNPAVPEVSKAPRGRRIAGGLLGGALLGAVAMAAVHTVPGRAASPAAAPLAAAPAVPQGRAAALAGGGYADVVERVAPAVVTVRSQRVTRVREQGLPDPFEEFFGRRAPRQPRRQGGLGSGVLVSPDGYILTNHHVVDGARQIDVELTDGRSFKATVVGSDPPSDLAVLKVGAKDLPTLPLGDSDQVRVGDVALAVGNPLGVGQTVTMGIVSAKGRATGVGDGSYEDFIQTDAPINQGNSGGALVNTRGELIGINSQILSPSGGNIGIGFAIPTTMARDVMQQLIKTGGVHRGMLGVTVQGISADIAKSLGLSQVRGALVSAVTPDSPADRAGLRRGDVILALDGQPVSDSNSLRNQVSRHPPGTDVALTLLRDGQQRRLNVRLGEMPRTADDRDERAPASADATGRLGLSVAPASGRNARGVEVTGLDPDGPAAEAGIREGDVLEEVNGMPVRSAADLRAAVARSKDRPALLLVRRGDHTLYVAVG